MKELEITEPIKIISQVDCNVTMTVEDGMRVTLFEPTSKPSPNVGEWWYHSTGVLNLIVEVMTDHGGTVKCIPTYGIPNDKGFSFHGIVTMTKKADMKEVEVLMMHEAKKKGWETTQVEYNLNNGALWLLTKGGDTIFNGKTGEWSEIIDEKKPLYTNLFEKHLFYKGDEVWRVRFHDLQPLKCNPSTSDYSENESYTEVLSSRKACLNWIYANIGKCRN